jgi:Family of unknown function (DUF6445)
MDHVTEPQISVDWIGTEREPIVTIDSFAPDPDALRTAAQSCAFEVIGEYYPGPRALVAQGYLQAVGEVVRAVMQEFYSCNYGGEFLRSYFSIATTHPGQLTLAQCIPHTDAYDDHQLAIVHFIGHQDLGGTAFFRHRSTGFETIDARRVDPYHAALTADFARRGVPAPGYIGPESTLFERIHLSEHRFNRALIYRGKLLHSAALDSTPLLPPDIATGRLTIATFIQPNQGNREARIA